MQKGGLPGREKKNKICSLYQPPTDKDMRDVMEQLQAPMIILGDFNTHNPLLGMSTRGRMLVKLLELYNFLNFNEKKKPTSEHTMAAN